MPFSFIFFEMPRALLLKLKPKQEEKYRSKKKNTAIVDTDHKKGGELFLRRTRRVRSLNCLKSFFQSL